MSLFNLAYGFLMAKLPLNKWIFLKYC